MAPLHHHFEQKGWTEPQIVIRFWIISVMLALAGLSTLKLRRATRHSPHRSFSVDRPASASTTEMIQNRITICGSVQPFCSK